MIHFKCQAYIGLKSTLISFTMTLMVFNTFIALNFHLLFILFHNVYHIVKNNYKNDLSSYTYPIVLGMTKCCN